MEWKKKQLKTLFKGGILVKGIWFLSIPLLVLLLWLLLGILLCPVDFLIPICSTLLCLRNVFLTIYLTGSILSKSLFGFDYLCYYRTSATLAFSEEQWDLICCAMLPPWTRENNLAKAFVHYQISIHTGDSAVIVGIGKEVQVSLLIFCWIFLKQVLMEKEKRLVW